MALPEKLLKSPLEEAPATLFRPSWDEYFLGLAQLAAGRSTCLRRQVGAVLVRDRHVVATGYNGAPAGLTHCAERGCLRQKLGVPSGERHELCYGVHAEQNTIIQAALHGASTAGSILYTTHQPCVVCAKMLVNAGVESIVCSGDYPDGLAAEILATVGVPVLLVSRR